MWTEVNNLLPSQMQAQLQATEEAVRLKDSLRAALKNVKSCGIFGLQVNYATLRFTSALRSKLSGMSLRLLFNRRPS